MQWILGGIPALIEMENVTGEKSKIQQKEMEDESAFLRLLICTCIESDLVFFCLDDWPIKKQNVHEQMTQSELRVM